MHSIASTTLGQVRGEVKDGLSVFLGIPYAAPPVGHLRWRAPVPMSEWEGVRDALEPGAASMQRLAESNPDNAGLTVAGPVSEDCLYLNVWTPSSKGSLPVMVWIHGGAYASGSGFVPMGDPQHLCRRDVVVVTINYRLGPFGFCHLDKVTGGEIPATGNEGLLDQVAALQWVRDNASSFGGDSKNVTLFGCSSGAASIVSLMTMPSAHGLFHKAIVQSGGDYRFQHSPQDNADWFVAPMMQKLSVATGAELMAASAEDILAAWPSIQELLQTPWNFHFPGQVIDGTVLPIAHEQALAQGSARGIAVLSGSTRDEYMGGVRAFFGDLTTEDLVEVFAARLGSSVQAREVFETYHASREQRGASTDFISTLAAIFNQKAELIPSKRLLDAQRKHGPVYSYIFDWMAPLGDGHHGAFHGLDVPYVFGTHGMAPSGSYGRGPAADALSNAMMDAWTAFAHSGNPSSAGLGDWPEYDARRRPTMMIGANAHIAEDPYADEIHLWDEVPTESLSFQSYF